MHFLLNRIEKHQQIERSTSDVLARYERGDIPFEKAVNEFTKTTISILLNVPVSHIEKSKDHESSQARMICYYVLKKTCDLSVRKMEEMYGVKHSAIHKKIKDLEFYQKKQMYKELLVVAEYVLLEIERKIKSYYLINQPYNGGQRIISGRYTQL